MQSITLTSERALEAIIEIDAAIADGRRPTVVVDDASGLSIEYLKTLAARHDLDVALSAEARLIIGTDGQDSQPRSGVLYIAVAMLLVLLAAAGFSFSP